MFLLHGVDWLDFKRAGHDVRANVALYNNFVPEHLDSRAEYHVLMIFSEPEKMRVSNDVVLGRYPDFDLVLAHDENVLASCPIGVPFPFGQSFVGSGFSNFDKEPVVSFIIGSKYLLPGHLMRHELCARWGSLTAPAQLFESRVQPPPHSYGGQRIVGDTKDEVFAGYGYHIAVENTKAPGYFSEKIIDCFATKTIPIYWGDPQIYEHFDTDGIIEVEDVQGIIEAVNTKVNAEHMANPKVRKAVEANFEAQKKFNQHCTPMEARIKAAVIKGIPGLK